MIFNIIINNKIHEPHITATGQIVVFADLETAERYAEALGKSFGVWMVAWNQLKTLAVLPEHKK